MQLIDVTGGGQLEFKFAVKGYPKGSLSKSVLIHVTGGRHLKFPPKESVLTKVTGGGHTFIPTATLK